MGSIFRAEFVSIRVGGEDFDEGRGYDDVYDVEKIGLGSNYSFDAIYTPYWAPRIPMCCGGNSIP